MALCEFIGSEHSLRAFYFSQDRRKLCIDERLIPILTLQPLLTPESGSQKPSSVDFIHCRYLFHGIRNWPQLFDQALRYILVLESVALLTT